MASKSSNDLSSRADERVMIFIDGSNLYHVLGENCGRHDLQFDKLGLKLANGRDLRRMYYYNIRQESERQPDLIRDQDKFLASLYDSPYLEVRLGVWKQRGEEMVEKGVDVMLATDLVVKALRDQYDTAIVVSGDGDFFPAFQAAKDAGKHVEVAAFESNLSPEAARAADVVTRMTKTWFTGLWTTSRGGSRREESEEAPHREEAPREVEKRPSRSGGRRRVSVRRPQERAAQAPTSEPARTEPHPPATEAPKPVAAAAQPDRPGIRRTPARRHIGGTVQRPPATEAPKPVAAAAQPDRPGIRRTPARRRIGGTVPPPVNGQGPAEAADAPAERALPAPPPRSAAEGEAQPRNESPETAENPDTEVQPGSTRRRTGWLRRLGIAPGDSGPGADKNG